MLTKKDLEILYRANKEAFSWLEDKISKIEALDLNEADKEKMLNHYQNQQIEYLDIKLKLDKELEAFKEVEEKEPVCKCMFCGKLVPEKSLIKEK